MARPLGARNRASREWKRFLQGCFDEALFHDPKGRARLVASIRDGTLEARVLVPLLAYTFGAPPRAVDVRHQGQVSLAQLVSGTALAVIDEEQDDDDEQPRRH